MTRSYTPSKVSRRQLLGAAGGAALGALARSTEPLQPAMAQLAPTDTTITIGSAAIAAGYDAGILLEPITSFQDPAWRQAVGPEFSSATKSVNWHFNQPVQGTPPSYAELQPYNQFIDDYAMIGLTVMIVYPHTAYLPDWLTQGGFTSMQLKNILYDYLTGWVSRFPSVRAWEFNELEVQSYSSFDFFKDQFNVLESSFDYVRFMCQAVKDANPSAYIILNDYGNHILRSERGRVFREMLRRVNSTGKWIDAAGLQTHVDVTQLPTSDDIIAAMQVYDNEAGVASLITELDLNLKNVQGSQDVRLAAQANAGRTVVRTIKATNLCKSITVAFAGDNRSWLETQTTAFGYSPSSNPTLFDDNLAKKPVYYAMVDEFLNGASIT